MKSFEVSQQAAPVAQPGKKKIRLADRALTASGIVLAAASAFFPWYVFFNEDKFGITVASMDRTRDLPEIPARNVFSVSPLAMVDKKDQRQTVTPDVPVDPLVTATVSKIGKEGDGDSPATVEQPFPGTSGFRLLHISNGRALIEDSSGMYMVKVGSILPDKSRLATLEERDGKWVIVTSAGNVYEQN